MASKAGKKSKKPVETTLGKAKPQQTEKDADISNIRKPIETSVSGIRQAIALLDTATDEVKNYVMYECDIMYECRICRNIFRSLANFILHKRNYCRDKFNPLDYLNNSGSYQSVVYPLPDTSNTSENCSNKPKEKEKKAIVSVIDKLLEKHKIDQLCKKVLSEDLKYFDKNKPLDKPVKNMEDCEVKFGNKSSIFLENIESNKSAVFQTLVRHPTDESMKSSSTEKSDVTNESSLTECSTSSNKSIRVNKDKLYEENDSSFDDTAVSMKSQVMEIHGILLNDKIVVGPDGKPKGYYKDRAKEIPGFPQKYLICTECNCRFTTRKTLTFHLRTRHNSSGKIYFCPTCKELLANPWCVFRHLLKVHRMSNKQVKNMRDKVHNSWVIQEDAPNIDVKKKTAEVSSIPDAPPTDAENQWINNIEEDNDLQMCAGCGKRFERRAALHSHSVMCAKRIAVCATIKENNAKKKEEEEALEKAKQKQALEALKGASKRKGKIIRWKTDPAFNITDIPNNPTDDNTQNDFIENNNATTNHHVIQTSNVTETNNLNIAENLVNLEKVSEIVQETLKSPQKLTESASITTPPREICIALPRQKIEDMEKLFREEQLNNSTSFIKSSIPEQNSTFKDIVNIDLKTSTTDVFAPCCTSEEDPLQMYNMVESVIEKESATVSGLDEGANITCLSSKESGEFGCLELKKKRKLSPSKKANEDHIFKKSREPKRILNTKVKHLRSNSTEGGLKVPPEKIIVSTHGNNTGESSLVDLENGFAGFSREETSCFQNDLSTLSYNNPLRKLQKIKKEKKINSKLAHTRRTRRKSLHVDNKDEPNLKNKKEKCFIVKAAPYMDQEQLCCVPCSLIFESFSLLLWHMSAHFSWFRFQCSKCSFICFNKVDCIMHARQIHRLTSDSSISSVVLPIPNWKTVLMSHEFRLLKDLTDLKGKHTDERIFSEDYIVSETPVNETMDILDVESDELFSDCDKNSNIPSSCVTILSDPSLNSASDIIDMSDSQQDCQVLKEPEELAVMPPDISEVFNNLKYKEYEPFEERTPLSGESIDESSNDTEFYCEIFKKIESGRPPKGTDDEDRSNTPFSTQSTEDVLGSKDSPPLTVRPSRIRTKAKLHEDFVYYDLSNSIKICDSSKKSDLKCSKVLSIKTVAPVIQKKK